MQKGFSLVELSIVLVILGLLTGGILAGQNLIRAAELRSVTTQFQGFITATQTFRDKYFALPGDMRNATAFWGDRATGTAACADSAVTDGTPGTCNGDGNGLLNNREQFTYWQHLQMAGLVEGTYTGYTGTGHAQRDVDVGVNVPRSRLGQARWSAKDWDGSINSSTQFTLSYGNSYLFGIEESSPDLETYRAIITPEEAWNIDTKMDDAKPGSGKVIATFWNNRCANASSTTDFSADYNLTDSDVECSLIFRQLF